MTASVEVPRRVFVLPRHKIVWVRIAKNGCTSILRMLSQVSGDGTCTAEASDFPEWSPESAVHDPKVHGLSRLDQLSARERRAALTEPGWWRFAVVRPPHARFLSAWIDKVFLRAPGTPHLWDEADDVVGGEGRIDVTGTFRRFVGDFRRNPYRWIHDQHFAPQHTLLARELFPDLEVIPLVDCARVHRRLQELGHDPGALSRLNESLHFDPRRVYDRATHATIAEAYCGDLEFDAHDATHALPDGEPLVLSKLESECVRKLRSASLRIRQLSRLAAPPRLTVLLQRAMGLR